MLTVPEGWFTMGTDDGVYNEGPGHSVYVNTFKIDRTEVSAREFAEFLNAVGNPQNAFLAHDKYSMVIGVVMVNGAAVEKRTKPDRYIARPGYEDHPANNVSWYGAAEYCRWKGKRLPTEAQWEKAARGTDERIYPWGNSSPNISMARYGQSWDAEGLNVMVPVNEMPDGASPYGVLNMAGNVWEWVEDYYFQNYCNFCRDTDWDYLSEEVFDYLDPQISSIKSPPKKNPPGPTRGHFRVLRGGSWFDSHGEYAIRATYRYWLREFERYVHTGFRCVSGPPRQRPAYTPLPEPKTEDIAPLPVVLPEPVEVSPPAPPVPVAIAAPTVPVYTDLGDVFFDFDKATLKEQYFKVLDEQVQWLKDNSDRSVMLVGHCDDRGADEYNNDLGLRRAIAVRTYLLEKGIEPDRMGVTTKGKASPFCFLLDPECRASNRRTRIVAYLPQTGTADEVFAALEAAELEEAALKAETAILPTATPPEPVVTAEAAPIKAEEIPAMATLEVDAPEDITEFLGLVDIDFQWDAIPGAHRYRYSLSRDRQFQHIIYSSPLIPETSYLATFLDYGTYYFKIEALGEDEHVVGSSPVRSFVIAPERPSAMR